MDEAAVVKFLHLLTRNTMAHFFLTQRHPGCVTKQKTPSQVGGATSLPCSEKKKTCSDSSMTFEDSKQGDTISAKQVPIKMQQKYKNGKAKIK